MCSIKVPNNSFHSNGLNNRLDLLKLLLWLYVPTNQLFRISLLKVNIASFSAKFPIMKKNENTGIDPSTSRMRSKRSTTWASTLRQCLASIGNECIQTKVFQFLYSGYSFKPSKLETLSALKLHIYLESLRNLFI